jgi:hypothetical protein
MKSIPQSYIEKVINNPEIQKLCKYEKGDWFWDGEKPVVFCKAGLGSFNPYEHKWLPTLDDLYNMIGNYKEQVSHATIMNLEVKKYRCKSLKELLLLYIMQKNYKKYWNPKFKKWELINE